MPLARDPLGYLCGQRGIGGTLKQAPEDFVVEELPLYEPCGAGEHAYLWIEKQGLSTTEAVRRLCRTLGVMPPAAGYAGLKDVQAVTRQWVSLHGVDPDAAAGFAERGLRVLVATRHRNKLRLGHLRGNRFTIRLGGVLPNQEPDLLAVVHTLHQRGVPNLFGPQRFGRHGNNQRVGRALLRGAWDEVWPALLSSATRPDEQLEAARRALREGRPEAALRALGHGQREERTLLELLQRHGGDARRAAQALRHEHAWRYLTAYQSLLFNRCLARRLPAIDRLFDGDVAVKHVNGAAFHVEHPGAEEDRLAAFAISPAGPLFGAKLLQAAGEAARLEAEVLAGDEVRLEDFCGAICGVHLTGERRPYRVPLENWRHTWEQKEGEAGEGEGEGGESGMRRGGGAEAAASWSLRVSFALPAGSFATAVLREIMRTPDLDPPMT